MDGWKDAAEFLCAVKKKKEKVIIKRPLLKTDKFWSCFLQEARLIYASGPGLGMQRRCGERLRYFLSGAVTDCEDTDTC